MKTLRYLVLCVLLTGFVTTDMYVFAQSHRLKLNRSSGLYGVRKGGGGMINVQLNGLYYYGDAESLKLDATAESMAFSVVANYSQMFSKHCAWRVGIGGGMLRGDNADAPKKNVDKSFATGFFEPAVGVLYYPFDNAGFYLYGGFSLGFSFIDYTFYSGDQTKSGKTFSVLPMIPIEIGYNFDLPENWIIGINLAVHQGLCDVPKSNLDAWPLEPANNQRGVDKWADGYFQFGLTIGYRIVR